jgi:DNA polymerase
LLSELIRTAFIAGNNKKFIVADYSAIEARVLSWLSDETWRNDVFKNNGDIYCASASAMFGVPVEKHGINSHLRQKGKVAELALGYGGGVEALKRMGGGNLSDAELSEIKVKWRKANQRIVRLWNEVDKAIRHTMTTTESTKFRNVEFKYKSGNLHIVLPSGRSIVYQSFKVVRRPDNGNVEFIYSGVDSITKKWTTIRTYGARIVENIVQAISRDLLAHSMKILKERKIVGSVHDELIIETAIDEKEKVKEILVQEMMKAATLRVKLVVDVNEGNSWYDAK